MASYWFNPHALINIKSMIQKMRFIHSLLLFPLLFSMAISKSKNCCYSKSLHGNAPKKALSYSIGKLKSYISLHLLFALNT